MKNREKYPNTEDALKAYEAHKKECKCDCTFDDWLDADEDAAGKFASRIAGIVAGALVAPLIIKDILKDVENKDPVPSAPSNGGEPAAPKDEGIPSSSFCPFCGSRELSIGGMMVASVKCKNCGMIVTNSKHSFDLVNLVNAFNRRADKPTD